MLELIYHTSISCHNKGISRRTARGVGAPRAKVYGLLFLRTTDTTCNIFGKVSVVVFRHRANDIEDSIQVLGGCDDKI